MAKVKAELVNVIGWLEDDPRNRFEIYDVDKEKAINKCASIEDLSQGGFRPADYFEKLADNGVRVVQIVKKKKNGSTYIREGCGLNFTLSTRTDKSGLVHHNNSVAASGASRETGAATPQQPPFASSSFGLGSPAHGLGLPEIMNMRSNSDRYAELKEAYDKLLNKYEANQDKLRTSEIENLKNQLGKDAQPSALDKLIEGIAANPAALPQIIQSFKGGNNPGLNAPVGTSRDLSENLSDTKNIVVDLISNNAQVTDEHVSAAYHVIVESLKGNQKFLNDYLKLLQQHKIIDHGGNPNNNSGN